MDWQSDKKKRQAREYGDYLRGKVETARASLRAGRGRSNAAVERKFAARRSKLATHKA